jgi:hypothetical protein
LRRRRFRRRMRPVTSQATLANSSLLPRPRCAISCSSRCIYPQTSWQPRGPRESNAAIDPHPHPGTQTRTHTAPLHPDPTRRSAWVDDFPCRSWSAGRREGHERAVHVRAPAELEVRPPFIVWTVTAGDARGPRGKRVSGGERRPRRHSSARRLRLGGCGFGAGSVQLARRCRGGPGRGHFPCWFRAF